ncbi:MAG: hypothetical protein A4E19_10725 [Nitrospira sp. SG-bin1]|nr:MAG: hypothetical protein A4E19_10725 [Nitrospira sp. SG-bin1]
MRRQYRLGFRVLLIGVAAIFTGHGIAGLADAETSPEERTIQHGSTSPGKGQGQSPANKRTSQLQSGESKTHGAASAGKGQGQSPANKRTSKTQPSDPQDGSDGSGEDRQGQSPSNK